jgi:hypothetical protein
LKVYKCMLKAESGGKKWKNFLELLLVFFLFLH